MKVNYRAFWTQKQGLEPEEYEDAFAPKVLAETGLAEYRFCVADGATETSFSGLWAQILCDAYVSSKEDDLAAAQDLWTKQVAGKELPWYAQEKLESGAFAAYCGLTLKQHKKKSILWTAKALGDCCLFHLCRGKLIKAIPLDHWQSFNNSPVLLSTRSENNVAATDKLVTASGICRPGDVFYLMSDAISCWFLKLAQAGTSPVEQLESLTDNEQFKAYIHEERQKKDASGLLMHNDDVTFMRIGLS